MTKPITDDEINELKKNCELGERAKEQPKRPNGSGHGTKAKHLVIECASDIEIEPIEWLWPGRLAVGKTTLLGGDPGLGKSQISAFITATLSVAGRWPCDEGRAPQKNVIILCAEDGAADTIVPRLVAAGADRSRIHIVTAVQEIGADGRRMFSLSHDMDILEREIRRIGNVGLVTIDPVDAYIGSGVDSHKNAAVRAVLEPLSEMAGRLRVAVLAITHFSKQPGGKAIYRFIGSIAHIGSARIGFTVVPDAENDGRVLLLHAKNNLAPRQPGLAFRLEQRIVADGIVASSICFDSQHVSQTADEALAAETGARSESSAKDAAVEFLKDVLANDRMAVADIEASARAAGMLGASTPINKDKPFRDAKKEIGVKATYDGYNRRWVWELSKAPSEGQGAPRKERAPWGGEGALPPDEGPRPQPDLTTASSGTGAGRRPTCVQCGGVHDGKERLHTAGDRTVWLHPECKPFWAEGDGWGLRH